MGTREAVGVERQSWATTPIERVMTVSTADDLVPPAADAAEALAQMRRTGKTHLYVVADGDLAGVLSLRDFLEVLTLKMEIEGHNHPGPFTAAKRPG